MYEDCKFSISLRNFYLVFDFLCLFYLCVLKGGGY